MRPQNLSNIINATPWPNCDSNTFFNKKGKLCHWGNTFGWEWPSCKHWPQYILKFLSAYFLWDKVLKNGPDKICGRQPLKKLKGYITSNFLKAVFHKFHLVHSWILCPIYYFKRKHLMLFISSKKFFYVLKTFKILYFPLLHLSPLSAITEFISWLKINP